MMSTKEFKLEGCTAAYSEGIISVTSNRDPTDRLVWTAADAEAGARIFRHLAPKFAGILRELASAARIARMNDRTGN